VTSRKPVAYGAWVLAFLLVLPGHAKASPTSFALSCAEQASASAGQPENDDGIQLFSTFTCAALTSPRALDVVIASQQWFVPAFMTRYYFYAYDRSDKPSWDKSTHKLIRFPKSLADGERHLTRWGRSTEQYFSDVGDGDCIVNSFYIFGRTTARAATMLVVIENGWRDRSDPLRTAPRPLRQSYGRFFSRIWATATTSLKRSRARSSRDTTAPTTCCRKSRPSWLESASSLQSISGSGKCRINGS
jgi:hypothetical protein